MDNNPWFVNDSTYTLFQMFARGVGTSEQSSVETLFTQKESQAPGTITLMSLEASSLKGGGDVTVLLLT